MTLSEASSADICLLIVGCVVFNTRAAALNEPSNAVAWNALTWFQSKDMACQFIYLRIYNQHFSSIVPSLMYGYHAKTWNDLESSAECNAVLS
jgi:hypothetical protein